MRHGSMIDPPNRFGKTRSEPDLEHLEWDQEYLSQLHQRQVEYLTDTSKTIISENNSPDIPFRYSLNPYRGCLHGCSYCYARNSHEYLGRTIPLATEQLSTQEVADTFSKVLNKKIEYKKLPVLITRLFLGKGLYKMFKWMNEKSIFSKEDIEATRKEFPSLLSLKDWIQMNFKL